MLKILALTLIKPIEEILVDLLLSLPVSMVLAQIRSVAVLMINHFEKVLQIHHLGSLFALIPGDGLALLTLLLVFFRSTLADSRV